jgi:acetyl-CoA carboxylase carboxyl transferase subunit alpha
MGGAKLLGVYMANEEMFEEPILTLEKKIEALSGTGDDGATRQKRLQLEKELEETRRKIYGDLSPWQKTLVARHMKRPYTADYIRYLTEDFVAIHGDRRYADDPAIICGMAVFRGTPVAIIGHQKGRDTKEKIYRNFGMPRPEGYRMALRVMRMAEKFGRPIFTFIDTPGAYPGIGAEERGQAEAIAVNLREMAKLTVPVLVTVTGEGGSGGALALGIGNRVNILEFAIYSVISPEGCAAILWKNPAMSKTAAEAMKVTSPDLERLGIVDEIIPEVCGGAHVDPEAQAALVGNVLDRQLQELGAVGGQELVRQRYDRFRALGEFEG